MTLSTRKEDVRKFENSNAKPIDKPLNRVKLGKRGVSIMEGGGCKRIFVFNNNCWHGNESVKVDEAVHISQHPFGFFFCFPSVRFRPFPFVRVAGRHFRFPTVRFRGQSVTWRSRFRRYLGCSLFKNKKKRRSFTMGSKHFD